MSHQISALIIGCGYVGSELKKYLLSQNWKVDGIKRSINKQDKNIQSVNVTKKFSLTEKYDFVFYMVSPGSYTELCYKEAFEQGVTNTLQALKVSKQKPYFIFISSTSLFSENSGKVVNENSSLSIDSFSKRSLRIGEELIQKSGLDFTIVRFSGIYGPGRYKLINRLKDGKALLKKKPYISNRIHLADCVAVLYHIVVSKNRKPLYIASDSEPSSYNKILIWLSKELGIKAPKEEQNSKVSRRLSNKVCSNHLLIESGYTFLYPSFREGFREGLQTYLEKV